MKLDSHFSLSFSVDVGIIVVNVVGDDGGDDVCCWSLILVVVVMLMEAEVLVPSVAFGMVLEAS